jgi:hypothetical protein
LRDISPLQGLICLPGDTEKGPRQTRGKGEHADMDKDGVNDKQLLRHVEMLRLTSWRTFWR